MASLHTVTEETKTIFRFGVIGIVLLLVFYVIFQLGASIKEKYFPTPKPPPTVSFGKLPAISFPNNATDQKLSYTFDTISGNLPTLGDRMTIFPMEKPKPNLLNLKRAENKAVQLGFAEQSFQVSDTKYVWTETLSPFRKLFFDTVSFNFSISSNYLGNPNLLDAFTGTVDEADAQNAATTLLTNIELYPNDIDTTKTKTAIYNIQNHTLNPATSVSDATLVQVIFFQKDIDSKPLYYANPTKSSLTFLFVGGRFNEKVVDATFNHFAVDQSQSGTYPIKTVNQATKELQEGKAYIASYSGNSKTVRITNVSLGYYMPDTFSDYLMPIIVFTGDNGFYAYVSAVTDAWIHTGPAQK